MNSTITEYLREKRKSGWEGAGKDQCYRRSVGDRQIHICVHLSSITGGILEQVMSIVTNFALEPMFQVRIAYSPSFE